MRLPWRKTRLPQHETADALAAKAAAAEHLAQAHARDPEVRRVARQLRELRESNHFSERLREMLRTEGQGHVPHA